MLKLLEEWWRKVTTKPCDGCGELIPIKEFHPTGKSRRQGLISATELELECPRCGHIYWVRK